MPTQAPFPIQPDLTAIAIQYRNTDMIADQVLPRVPVGKQDFKYFKHTLADGFTIPDTKVGRRSPPTQVEFTATEQTASCIDYALDDSVPNEDIENAGGVPNGDPVTKATQYITNLIELDREQRAAGLVFANASYAASTNRATLSGTTQWSDYVNSNPIDAILTALDGCVMRPNLMVVGQSVWTKLRQHPKVIASIFGAVSSGVPTREQVAAVLELEQLLVGKSFINTTKKGQNATLARVWGKHAAFLYRDSLATAARGTTFGFTAQFGGRIAGSFEDKDIGMRGGLRVRAGESVKEVITANDLGYFFENAVA